MNREELIQELKWSFADKGMIEVVAYGEVEINGEVIVLKNRLGYDKPQYVCEYNKSYHSFIQEDLNDIQGKCVNFSQHAFSMRGWKAMYRYIESKEKNKKIVIEGEVRDNILEGQVVASVYDYNTHTDLDDSLLIHEGKKVRVTIEVLS